MARTKDVLDNLAEWYGAPAGSVATMGDVPATGRFAGKADGDLRSALRRGLVRIGEVLLAWHDRARERRALVDLSEDLLRDIGVSGADARREAARPFWRS